MDLGDPYRQMWKRRIKNKGPKQKQKVYEKSKIVQDPNENKSGSSSRHMRLPNREIVSTLFVPPTKDGQLTELLKDLEEKLESESSWGVKIIEKSGTPIVQLLKPKFPMIKGCIIGELCIICKKTGLGCDKRNIIYSMECLYCEDMVRTNAEMKSESSQEEKS